MIHHEWLGATDINHRGSDLQLLVKQDDYHGAIGRTASDPCCRESCNRLFGPDLGVFLVKMVCNGAESPESLAIDCPPPKSHPTSP